MLSKFKPPLTSASEESFSFLDIARRGVASIVQSDHWSELVDLLIERGVNLDSRNRNYETPLHLACLSGNKKMVLLLIARGANIQAINE
jgi:ankyrin repeat protein